VFIYIALTHTEPLIIVTGLFVGMMIAASLGSKSYLNPGFVIGDYAQGELVEGGNSVDGRDATSYIGCELIGVVLAIILVHIKNEMK